MTASLEPHIPHSWSLTPKEAVALQRQLAGFVDTDTPINLDAIKTVAGVDVSVKDNSSRAALVLLSFPDMTLLEVATASIPTPFPYISGLLSFREGGVIMEAYQKLSRRADVYVFDGMGIMHPRRLGIASHMGLWFDAPTVGCGKTYLLGDYEEPASEKGAYSPVTHKSESIGIVLRTRSKVKPVFISPGHKATIDSARQLIMACTGKYRLPEPIRAAHNHAGGNA